MAALEGIELYSRDDALYVWLRILPYEILFSSKPLIWKKGENPVSGWWLHFDKNREPFNKVVPAQKDIGLVVIY